MNLLIDIGNTRIKWAYDKDGELIRTGAAERGDELPAAMEADWREGPNPERVVIAGVDYGVYHIMLNQLLQRLWQISATYLRVKPGIGDITLAYARPEHFGVDRWLNLIAVRSLQPGAVAVVSCGTALTIDILDPEGRHQGGVITPGLQLMQSALVERAEGVRRGMQGQQEAAGWLGCSTAAGIRLGSRYALAGTIEHLVSKAERELGMPLSVIIAGGDAPQVAAELDRTVIQQPDLVFKGMQIVIGGGHT